MLHAHDNDTNAALRSARREAARLRREGDETRAEVYDRVGSLLGTQRPVPAGMASGSGGR